MGRKTPISFNYKNMLKSIATARSENTAKQEKKRATIQTILFLI